MSLYIMFEMLTTCPQMCVKLLHIIYSFGAHGSLVCVPSAFGPVTLRLQVNIPLLTPWIKGSSYGITYISHHIYCLEVVYLVSFADLAWYNLDISLATTFLVVWMSFHLYLLMVVGSQFFYLMVLGMQRML